MKRTLLPLFIVILELTAGNFCFGSKKAAQKNLDKYSDLVMISQELLQAYHRSLPQDLLQKNIGLWLSKFDGDKNSKSILADIIIGENYLLNKEDKNNLNHALTHYERAWDKVEETDFKVTKATIKHQLGNILYRREEYVRGLEYLLRADWMMHHLDYKRFANLGTYFANLGYAYAYYFEDFENGKYYLELALKNGFANPALRYAAYNFIGLLYRQKGDIDSSHRYFAIALEGARQNGDSAGVGEIVGNIGLNYFMEKRYDLAAGMLQTNFRIALQNKNWTSAALSNIILTKMDVATGKMEFAGAKIVLTRSLIDSMRITGTNKALYLASYNMYLSYLDWAKWRNEKGLIIGVQDTLLMYKDSLYATRDLKTALKVQIDLIKENSDTQIQLLKSEEIRKVWVRNFIILVCVGLFVVLALYIYRLRLRSRQDQQKIADYLDKITEKNQLLKHYEHKIETEESKIQVTESSIPVTDLSTHLHFLQSTTIHTEEDWQQFREIFEKVYPGFFNEVSDKIPNVSPAELRFLALTKLGIPAKQMAQSLGIAMDSVRKLRYRLRKKIEQNLKMANEDFLNFNI